MLRGSSEPSFTPKPSLPDFWKLILPSFNLQDLPDGQYAQLKGKGKAAQDKGWVVIYYALTNYRTWVMCITYGYCFGVELTVDNVITNYYYDRFHIDLTTAGEPTADFSVFVNC